VDVRPEETPLLVECTATGELLMPGLPRSWVWIFVVICLVLLVADLARDWASSRPWWVAADDVALHLSGVGLGLWMLFGWLPGAWARLAAHQGGLVIATRRAGDLAYTWDEVRGFRGKRRGEAGATAPRYTTGSVAPSATLVLPDREVGLAGCPAEQRERLVQVVEQHLRERTS